jgi:hypothetical protein
LRFSIKRRISGECRLFIINIGSDGKSSQIVEYRIHGVVVFTYTVPSHNDGLKVNPVTHELWALQNEDANPNLVIINPATKRTRSF